MMKVVILAGGLGTRLRRLFPDRAKAMVVVGGKPFLEHQLSILAAQGFTDFVLCVGHLAPTVQRYFGDGSRWNWQISYALEHGLLGTAGAIRNAAPHLDDTFLVLNGDTYLAIDYHALVDAHSARNTKDQVLGTLASLRVEDGRAYGAVRLATDGRVLSFAEKAERARGQTWISAGAYVLEPAILSYIPSGRAVSLERETFPSVLQAGGSLYGYRVEGVFVDIGTPQGYETLCRMLCGQTHQ